MGDTDATLMRHNVTDDARSLIDDEVHRDCEYYVYSQLRDCIDVIDDDYERLRAENAKLRELVQDMFTCISHANEQDWFYFEQNKLGCGLSCTVNGESCGLSVLTGRMRELGIEVSE